MPTGVVIIRAWIENRDSSKLRARITCVLDLGQPEEEVHLASSAEEIVGVVRRFVAAFTKVE